MTAAWLPRSYAGDAALIAGAQVYREQCASCHGVQGHPARFAAYTYPGPPQLWAVHKNNPGVVGVSDDPASETYLEGEEWHSPERDAVLCEGTFGGADVAGFTAVELGHQDASG